MLQSNKDIPVHQRNSQILMTKVYKVVKGIEPGIMNNLLIFREYIHNIRNFQIIANENKNTVGYGDYMLQISLFVGKSFRRILASKILQENLKQK